MATFLSAPLRVGSDRYSMRGAWSAKPWLRPTDHASPRWAGRPLPWPPHPSVGTATDGRL